MKSYISDSHLIEDYKRSDDISDIETLFLRYSHIVFLVCYKYLHHEEESKDAVMEVFQKLLVDCKKYDIVNFKAWLHTVTKNHCLMKLRKDGKLKLQYIPADEIDTIVVENDDFDNLIDVWETNAAMLLKNLNVEQKSCMELFYFKGKSYKEIAHINSMDVRQVKSHIQNGKRNLKNLLEKKMGGKYVCP